MVFLVCSVSRAGDNGVSHVQFLGLGTTVFLICSVSRTGTNGVSRMFSFYGWESRTTNCTYDDRDLDSVCHMGWEGTRCGAEGGGW
jgi:hypothetical protein